MTLLTFSVIRRWAFLTIFSLSTAAWGQITTLQATIERHKAALPSLNYYFNDLAKQLNGDKPFNARTASIDARWIEYLSYLPKEDVPSKNIQYRSDVKQMELLSATLSKVAARGNVQELKSAFNQLQATCNSCHQLSKQKPIP